MAKHQKVNVRLHGADWVSWQSERYRGGEGVCCGYLACLLNFIMPASVLLLIKALWWMFFATGEHLLSALAIGCLFYQRLSPLADKVLQPPQVKLKAVTPVRPTSFHRNYLKSFRKRSWNLRLCILWISWFLCLLFFMITPIRNAESLTIFKHLKTNLFHHHLTSS